MGRTEKNFNSLCAQRDQTIDQMEKARVYEVGVRHWFHRRSIRSLVEGRLDEPSSEMRQEEANTAR